ncbi:hypothetical protein M408DRAFT_110973 [Serendipita vermifera MAFF 305830]|uniref:Uncharacterized protein n=1 Tax=Serendipita vermifera MAFF 305830 TaxID=933852 RepID=A0A0C2WUR2_SERVB|nr:hypothetical protein M408DRAFT_110973 [Serendipita vermifera MAFF 305830]
MPSRWSNDSAYFVTSYSKDHFRNIRYDASVIMRRHNRKVNFSPLHKQLNVYTRSLLEYQPFGKPFGSSMSYPHHSSTHPVDIKISKLSVATVNQLGRLIPWSIRTFKSYPSFSFVPFPNPLLLPVISPL